MSRQAQKRFQQVKQAFDRLDAVIALPDAELFKVRPEISLWSVAAHVHHIAVANGLMLAAAARCCRQEAPAEPGGRINAIGRAVLLSGRMPRGKGKAPAVSVPPPQPDRAQISAVSVRAHGALETTESLLSELSNASWRAAHPYFGPLSALEWLRLTAIHTDHHLRIMDEIQDAG